MALSPSHRVNIIREAARRLEDESWPFIDLTLSQFKAETREQWGSDKNGYVITMLAKAADDSLVALAHHIGMEVENPEPGVEPPFWKEKFLRVFLSHLSAHRQFAAELKEAMDDFGLSVFVAHNDIEPTAEWQDEIKTALSTCEVLIALLHDGFSESHWTDQEVGFAMGRGIPVFSVRFDQDPYGFIGSLQAFQGKGKSAEQLAKEIFEKLLSHKQTQRRMADIVVSLFENSSSFASAKRNVEYLEKLTTWNQSFTDRILKATKANNQIADAYGVPAKVESLVAKWKAGMA